MIKLLSILVATMMLLPTIYLTEPIQNVNATGGGIDVAGIVDPMILRAIEAIKAGNMDKALYELNNAHKEFLDTFNLEKHEEDE